ncbi:lysine exporter LysO family protein [Bacteroides nordii]|uniref:lysine exporter LysO family protein n=1 Tax=Bacteroides nordii TaxID=291645 RepID=UPI00203BF8B2|nr:lysine exporter LysO family protein [Bacteroides nordii]GFZ41604.1 membrane protein [Bacteroides nordii]
MKGSLIIVSFFVVGTLCGLYHLIPSDFIHSKLSYYALCVLMFCVGVSIGNDPNTLKSFRSLNPRLVFLPIMTILGTLAGCAVVSLFLNHRSPADCMAVGAGFGYYSLSSIFITEYKGPELGTIALLSNIIREIIALLCAPLLVRYFGRLAPISVGGATTMDTTLPIITRCCGKEFVIVSIFHGFIVDFSVPFLVTLFCTV